MSAFYIHNQAPIFARIIVFITFENYCLVAVIDLLHVNLFTANT